MGKRTQHSGNARIHVFGVLILLVTSLVIYKLFTLTFVQHEALALAAKNQQSAPSARLSGRGSIYAFDLSANQRKLVAVSEIKRVYPLGMFAAHVLGFVGYSGRNRVGQYGVEASYDNVLSGLKRTQTWTLKSMDSSRDGEDIVLTIDPNIQDYVAAKLNAVLKRWSSPHGTIIVQDPMTGAILAMASSPSFDPNNYQTYGLSDFPNPATQEIFEPGSSFKPITMSAAIDSGAVTPDTTYNDTGAVTIGAYTIRNYNEKANGIQTMRQVLERSLNTGTIFAERKTGDDTFLNYIVAFGIGQKAGIDLGGELSGNISNLYQGRAVNFATASFGQGIAVTPLQLINAYSAIANGGKLMRPYVVKEILHPDGSTTPTVQKILGAPITEKTATQMKSILTDVVDRGFDKARIKGYDIAGKTGTAQIPDLSRGKADARGGYLEDKQFIHNFVGFAPSYNPRFVVLIKMDRPQGITFAADSLSPVFGDIAQYLIRYFKIPPTRS